MRDPRAPSLLLTLLCLAPALAGAETLSPERFDFPVSGTDTFDFASGGPWMASEGDSLYGERLAAALPVANRIQVHIWVDQAPQACTAILDFYFDDAYLGRTNLAAVADLALIATPLLPIPDDKLVQSDLHSLEIVLTNDIASCGEGSGIRFTEDDSYIVLDFVPSDVDGDGFASIPTLGDDCDDTNAAINPDALEVEDGLDNDCDGKVDEGTRGYDPDGDGVSEADGDCAPEDGGAYPGAPELSDGVDNDCDEAVDEGTDAGDDDGDGYSEDEGDCDDTSVNVHPGTSEVADGEDNDCDGDIDEGLDPDGDGVLASEGDCAPDDGATYPGAPELSDGVDNDCDGEVDEGLEGDPTPTPTEPPEDETPTGEGEPPEACGCDAAPDARSAGAWALMLGVLGILRPRGRRPAP